MNPIVIYHGNCWDGFCAAWILRKMYPGAEFIPAHYGAPPPDQAFDRDRPLFIVDFSYPRAVMFQLAAMRHADMVVLDHHKTAEAALSGLVEELGSNNCGDALSVTFDMGKSGGRLAWEYYWDQQCSRHSELFGGPSGETMTRNDPPWLVRYTEDRDLWRHALPSSMEINAWLRSWPLDFDRWDAFSMIGPESDTWVSWIDQGHAIRRREQQIVDDHVRHAKEIEMDGHKILAVNATVLFSEIAGKLAEDRPFGAAYFDRQDGKRQWSLRSRDGGVDVSEIAKSHGGGGHRNAAGFEESE